MSDRANHAQDADYALEAEAEFTPGLRVREVLNIGTQIANGLRGRCEATGPSHGGGVICAVSDVMFLVDAYREALRLIDGGDV